MYPATRQSKLRLFGVLLLIHIVFVHDICKELRGAEDPKRAGLVRPNKKVETDSEGEVYLPKYAEMELPSAEEFLKSKPFDWIVLKTLDVLVVEPVGPRPETLTKLNNEYERYLKGRSGRTEGTERLSERRRQFLRIPLTLIDPGAEQDSDYTLETKMIQKIDYFEDLVLRRTNLLIDESRLPLAYDLLLFVDRRHKENNLRQKEAAEALKAEEAAAAADAEEFKYTVPAPLPLKLDKTWPKFDETHHRLLLVDAELRSARGDHESALRLLEDLWDRNRTFTGLSELLGTVVDRMISSLVEQSDFRQARFFWGRLIAKEPQHSIALKWKSDLSNRTTALIAEARAASLQGNAALGASLADQAARIWPDTPGLRDAHRELNDRHQIVRLGVMRLPGEATGYPFDSDVDASVHSLTDQRLFEPVRVDERGVRYRSTMLESWEPMDLGRRVEFTLRLKRADWEARPLITAADIFGELSARMNPARPEYDERLSGVVEQISVQSPSEFAIHFRQLPLRLEALLQLTIPLGDQSRTLNQDIPVEATDSAGRLRFYQHSRDDKHVTYRRVRAQPTTTKSRHIDDVSLIRYESWDRALQGLLRGEIVGIPHVEFQDLNGLQGDNRFFVVPYVLPKSHLILFNPESAALRDSSLRRALTLAIARDELISQSTGSSEKGGLVRPLATPFPSVSYGHNRVLREPPFDPHRSATLAMTAKKQSGGELPVLHMVCPPDFAIRNAVKTMIENWRRVGITVQLRDEAVDAADRTWDLAYRTTRFVEPLMEIWPLLTLKDGADVEGLRPLPDRVRRQLLDLERSNDWTSATKRLHRIETELLVETRFIPLWEVEEFFVARRNLVGLPPKLMNAFHDAERWTLQSWYPQEAP